MQERSKDGREQSTSLILYDATAKYGNLLLYLSPCIDHEGGTPESILFVVKHDSNVSPGSLLPSPLCTSTHCCVKKVKLLLFFAI